MQRNKTISAPETRAPYILVITPTTELALQVSKVVRAIANVVKFRSACVTAISDLDAEQKKLRLGVDIMVSTPGRILSLLVIKSSVNFKTYNLIRIIACHVIFCLYRKREKYLSTVYRVVSWTRQTF